MMANLAIGVLVVCFTVNISRSQVALYGRPIFQSGYYFPPGNFLSRQQQTNVVPISYDYRQLNGNHRSGNNAYSHLLTHPQKEKVDWITSKETQNPKQNHRYKIVYRKTYKVRQNGVDTNNRKSVHHTIALKDGYHSDNVQPVNRISVSTNNDTVTQNTDPNNENEFADFNKTLQKFYVYGKDYVKNDYYFPERHTNCSNEGHSKGKTIVIVKSNYAPYKYLNYPVTTAEKRLEVNKSNDINEVNVRLVNTVNNSFDNINLNKDLLYRVLNSHDINDENESIKTFRRLATNPNTYDGIQKDFAFVKHTNIQPEPINSFNSSGNDYDTFNNDHELSYEHLVGRYPNSVFANNDSIFESYILGDKERQDNENIDIVDVPSSKYQTQTHNNYDGNSGLNTPESPVRIKFVSLTDAGNDTILNDSNNQIKKVHDAESTDKVEHPDFALNILSNTEEEVTNRAIDLEQQTLNRSLGASNQDLSNYVETRYKSIIKQDTNRVTEDNVPNLLPTTPKFVSVEPNNLFETFDNTAHSKEYKNSLKHSTEYVSEIPKIDHKEMQRVNHDTVISSIQAKRPEKFLNSLTKTEEPVKETSTAKNTNSTVQLTADWFRKYFSPICQEMDQNLSECWLSLYRMSHLNLKNPVNEKALLIFRLFLKMNGTELLDGLVYALQKLTCNETNDDLLNGYRKQLNPKKVTVIKTETTNDKHFVIPEMMNRKSVKNHTRNKFTGIDDLDNTIIDRGLKIPISEESLEYDSDILNDYIYHDNDTNRHIMGEGHENKIDSQPYHDNVLGIITEHVKRKLSAADNSAAHKNLNYISYHDIPSENVKLIKDLNNISKEKDRSDDIFLNVLDSIHFEANASKLPLRNRILDIYFPDNDTITTNQTELNATLSNTGKNTNDLVYLMDQDFFQQNNNVTKDVHHLKADSDISDHDKEKYSLETNSLRSKTYIPQQPLQEKPSDIQFPVDKVINNAPETNTMKKINNAVKVYNKEEDILSITRFSNENSKNGNRNKGVLSDKTHNGKIVPHFSEYLPLLQGRVSSNVIEETHPELYEAVNSDAYLHLNGVTLSSEKAINKEYSAELDNPSKLRNENDTDKKIKHTLNPIYMNLQREFTKSTDKNAVPFNAEHIMNDSLLIARVNNLIMKTILQLKLAGILDVKLENFIDVVQNEIMPSVIRESNVCQERAYLNFVIKLQNLVMT